MDQNQTHFVVFFFLFLFSCTAFSTVHAVKSWHHEHHNSSAKPLFVFGDSYVDTGNLGKLSPSWKEPYGISFPGKPSGRFSDGHVLTDFIASFLGIKSPVPFERSRNITKKSKLGYGMNFAYGGTGVFPTLVDAPNMTIQIDYFQQVLKKNVYSKHELDKSVALVSVAGNDYTAFIFTNGSIQNAAAFTKGLVKQLVMDLKRIRGLGVQNVLVSLLEPIGCMPILTAQNSHKKCIQSFNSAAHFHNRLLKEAVKKLNKEINHSHNHDHKSGRFIILDMYKRFKSALKKEHLEGKLEVKKRNPLEPCCVGVEGYMCGDLDNKGVKKYSVCTNPESSFFWDIVHPTQSGWHAVYSSLKSSLSRIYKSP